MVTLSVNIQGLVAGLTSLARSVLAGYKVESGVEEMSGGLVDITESLYEDPVF